jgi:hypothetical protein
MGWWVEENARCDRCKCNVVLVWVQGVAGGVGRWVGSVGSTSRRVQNQAARFGCWCWSVTNSEFGVERSHTPAFHSSTVSCKRTHQSMTYTRMKEIRPSVPRSSHSAHINLISALWCDSATLSLERG